MYMHMNYQKIAENLSLPPHYEHVANAHFLPLSLDIIAQLDQQQTRIIGIQGSQGSGKSTLADFICAATRLAGFRCLNLSIDDFYLTAKARATLAKTVHPLLKTRGVPGTHDAERLLHLLQQLKLHQNETLIVPRFDKAADDQGEAEQLNGPFDLVILEGWCIGLPPLPDDSIINYSPINELERYEDAEGIWLNYYNESLSRNYQKIWKQIDELIVLQAPSFECVFNWRLEQEDKLRQRAEINDDHSSNRIMDAKGIARFIQHYERLSRHGLNTLRSQANILFQLDQNRQIVDTIRSE